MKHRAVVMRRVGLLLRVSLVVSMVFSGPAALAGARWNTSQADLRLISQLSTSRHNIKYGPNGDGRLTMDLFLPKLPPGSAAPVILWIHGGAWRVGDKGWIPGLRSLLEAGFAVASVNYRLAPDSPFPAQIDDCREAVRYLRRNAGKLGIAADRIGAWGESAGGHLAALLGTTGGEDSSARVSAVCDWYGPTELVSLGFLSAILKASGGADPVGDLLGGAVSQLEDVARQASPVTHVSPDDAPFLIMHGNADTVVPLNQSQMFADALKKAGVDVEFVTLSGARHSDDRFLEPENLKRVISFFQKHLNAQSVDAGTPSGTSPG